jgi:release factor glutamine methyltransferase
MTLRKLAAEAEAHLALGPHPDRARRDAEALLRHLLQRDRAWLLGHFDDAEPAHLPVQYRSLIARRFTGEPMQYITGEAEFYGLALAVAPGVLIPRPETEHLVEELVRLAGGFHEPSIADIGTGSGAIAIALAHSLPDARVFATDLYPEPLAIARRNAEKLGVSDRITFLQGDLLEPLADQTFELIASNPPYIPLPDQETLSVEVREYEPHSALFAGSDGLEIYRKLIPAAWELLISGGWLAMEIGYGQGETIEALLRAANFTDIYFVQDYQGIARVACGRKK